MALYYWKGRVSLLTLDVDEFVVMGSNSSITPVLELPCTSIARYHIFCPTCSHLIPDKEHLFLAKSDSWVIAERHPKFNHPKLLLDPDKIDCLYVHWAVCVPVSAPASASFASTTIRDAVYGQCQRMLTDNMVLVHVVDFFDHRSGILEPEPTDSSKQGKKRALRISTFVNDLRQHALPLSYAHPASYAHSQAMLVRTKSLEKGSHEENRFLIPTLTSEPYMFHLIWSTDAEGFDAWRVMIILSIQKIHSRKTIKISKNGIINGNIKIRIYTNTLSLKLLHKMHPKETALLDPSKLEFVPITNDLFMNTPIEKWWLLHPELHGRLPLGDYRYSHMTDILRLAILWTYGGAYLDFDMLLLRPISFYTNSFALQKDLNDPEIMADNSDPYNFAIAVFDKHHPFLYTLMNNITISYDPKLWPCVGPRLVTFAVYEWQKDDLVKFMPLKIPQTKMKSDPRIVSIFPHKMFYPYYWRFSANLTTRSDHSIADFHQLKHNAVTVHIWSHVTKLSNVEKGSVLDLLFVHYMATNFTSRTHGSSGKKRRVALETERRGKYYTNLLSDTYVDFSDITQLALDAGLDASLVYTCPTNNNKIHNNQIHANARLKMNMVPLKGQIKTRILRNPTLKSDEVLIFFRMGFWKTMDEYPGLVYLLDLISKDSVEDKLTKQFVLVANSCGSTSYSTSCIDNSNRFSRRLTLKYPQIDFSLIKVLVNSVTASSNSVLYVAKFVYDRFPTKKYYIGIDEHTILQPKRMRQFLLTLDIVVDSREHPVVFGSVIKNDSVTFPQDDNMVYGFNHMAIKKISTESMIRTDYNATTNLSTTFVHCEGFFTSQTFPSQWHIRRAITWTQGVSKIKSLINSDFGKSLKNAYSDKNEWLLEYPEQQKNVRKCAEFNQLLHVATVAGISRESLYVCPMMKGKVDDTPDYQDDKPGQLERYTSSYCPHEIPTKSQELIKTPSLVSSDVVLYLAINKKCLESEVPALYWWLKLLNSEDPNTRVTSDIVVIGDSCSIYETSVKACFDHQSQLVKHLSDTFFTINFYFVRLSSNHRINLATKMYYGSKLVYKMFPNKKFYVKFDDDTIILPTRLHHFLGTLDATVDDSHPFYFGTVHDKLPYTINWVQGGSGYGMNLKGMQEYIQAEPPTDHFGYGTSEDYFLWSSMSKRNITLIHCGGFFANTVTKENDWHFRSTITFHRVKDNKWLDLYGTLVLSYYNKYATSTTKGYIDTF